MSSVTPPRRYAVLSRKAALLAHLAAVAALLAVGAVGVMAFELTDPQPIAWLAIPAIALALGATVLATMSDDPGPGIATGAMLAGIVAVVVVSWSMHAAYPEVVASTASFVLLVPKLVLLALGSALDRFTPNAAGAVLGAAIAELATIGAAIGAQLPWHPDAEFAVIAVTVSLGGWVARIGLQQHAAAFASFAAVPPPQRRDNEDVAANSRALVHDTVLNELILLTKLPSGALPASAAREIRESLDRVERTFDATTSGEQPPTAIAELVRRFGDSGLDVQLSGQPEEVQAILGPAFEPFVAALDQCLSNTLRHSGADSADLVITHDDSRVSALVVDEGRGFDPASVPAERLGLRESVHARVERLGGAVTLWSSPGRGTTVAIEVPTSVSARSASAARRDAAAPVTGTSGPGRGVGPRPPRLRGVRA